MKSEKKRSGREKPDKRKANKAEINQEKTGQEETIQEKTIQEEADKENPNSAETAVDDNDSAEAADSVTGEDAPKKVDIAAQEGSPEPVDANADASAQSQEYDAQEEEGEDWENDVLPDDLEEETEPSKPWVVALVFCGMIFAAAVICVQLWVFTHSDKEDDRSHNVFAEVTAEPGSQDDFSTSQMPVGTGDQLAGNQGGDGVSGSDPFETETPASNQNRVTTQEGRVIIFTECDDMITPKEYVNLRTEPSTSQGEATVGCMLNNGEMAHRTGISEEMGWSRVEYNDQILYVVTSYVNVVKDEQPAQ